MTSFGSILVSPLVNNAFLCNWGWFLWSTWTLARLRLLDWATVGWFLFSFSVIRRWYSALLRMAWTLDNPFTRVGYQTTRSSWTPVPLVSPKQCPHWCSRRGLVFQRCRLTQGLGLHWISLLAYQTQTLYCRVLWALAAGWPSSPELHPCNDPWSNHSSASCGLFPTDMDPCIVERTARHTTCQLKSNSGKRRTCDKSQNFFHYHR